MGARARRPVRAGRLRPARPGLRPDLRRLPGHFADAARRPGLLREGRRPRFRAAPCVYLGRGLSAQHLRRPALRRTGGRRRRVPRHGGGDPPAHRAGGRAPGARRATRPGERLRHDQLRPRPGQRRRHPRLVTGEEENPILRTGLPTLPPAARGRVALGLPAAAALGRFELQQCGDCGTVQYPPREACQNCLSTKLLWTKQSGAGELLASTVLHHSNDLFFRERLPWRLGLIKLAGGPTVVAHLHGHVPAAPAAVRVTARLDRAGQAVLVALPHQESSDMADDRQLREFTCDPKSRKVLVTDGKTGVGQELVEALADAGSELIWVGYAEPWKKFPCFEELQAIVPVTLLPLDVSDSKNVREVAAEIGGKVDILINNAEVH